MENGIKRLLHQVAEAQKVVIKNKTYLQQLKLANWLAFFSNQRYLASIAEISSKNLI
jgi:hypothetical protein